MTGCFGLLDGYHDKLRPSQVLVEQNPMLDIFDLYRRGLIRDDQIQLETNGSPSQTVRVIWHNALTLPMFQCPECERACYRLHFTETRWRCRKCAKLAYTSDSRHRTVTGKHAGARHARAVYLRRRLGVSPVLFSAIEPRPLRPSKWWRLLLELRRVEAQLVEHLRINVADVLEKRYGKQSPGSRNDHL